MSKLKEKFPFFEFFILVIVNVCTIFLSIINAFYYSIITSEFEDEPSIDFLLLIILNIIINIALPLFVYVFICFLSQNKIFLQFLFVLKNNLMSKIFLCSILFIISPMPLVTLLLFSSHAQALRDLFFNFSLSMGFPLMLFFILEPIVTQMIDKHFEKHPNSKSWLKKNYDLRMGIQKEL